jgi:hypothetical protein
MKHTLIIFLVTLVFNVGICAQSVPIMQLEMIHTFPVGDGLGELGSEPGIMGSGFADRPLLGSGAEDGFIIHDGLNRRIILFNDQFIQQRSIETSLDIYLTPVVAEDGGTIILQSQSQGLYVFADFGYADFPIYIFPEFRNYRSFAYYDDVLFVHDAELNLWSIPEPVMDQAENRAKLLNERQTREYVNERWGATGEVQVDDEGRLFIDGQLVTRDFPTWLGERGITTDFEPRYIGTDRTGTTYWSLYSLIYIYEAGANRGNTIRYDASLVSGYPTVEYQTGDIYFLGRPVDNNTSIPLYRIPNDWSPIDASLQSESGTSREVSQNPQATVINSRLRVRSAPSLDGEMLGLLEIGEEVRVLEKSDQELNIGELTDFWYRIDNGNGLTGWAYGAFLRMDGE